MKHIPGTEYQSTNKFSLALTLPALLVTVGIAALTGYLYGLVSFYNPLIYINVIVLVIVGTGGTMLAGLAGKAIAKSRNLYVDAVLMLVAGFVACHGSWAYYYGIAHNGGMWKNLAQLGPVETYALHYTSGHGMSISRLGTGGISMPAFVVALFYLIELAAFFVPVFFVRSVFGQEHFCEDCNVTNEISRFRYAVKPVDFSREMAAAYRGDLGFMAGLKPVNKMEEVYPKPFGKEGMQVLKFHLGNCKKCGDNAIVDIFEYCMVLDENGKPELKNEIHLLARTYYDVRKVDVGEAEGTNYL